MSGHPTRRKLLRLAGAAAAVAGSGAAGGGLAEAVGIVPAAPVVPDPDGELLAFAERFQREFRRYNRLRRRSERIRAAAADPSCSRPDCAAAWRAWHDAYGEAKASAEASFAVAATTPAGALAKARIILAAHGDETASGNSDLTMRLGDWIAIVVADLEAMASAGDTA
jgi:hypothetical protein